MFSKIKDHLAFLSAFIQYKTQSKGVYFLICILLLVACVFLLMRIALINGYPLNSLCCDSTNYLINGFEKGHNDPPRTFAYGVFLYYASLGKSLWYAAIFQCIACALAIYLFVSNFLKGSFLFKLLCTAGSILFLSYFSSIGLYSSNILPDIFTPITFLCLAVMLNPKHANLLEKILSHIVFMVSSCMHSASIPTVGMILGMYVVAHILIFGLKSIKRLYFKLVLVSVGCAFVLNGAVYYCYTGKFSHPNVGASFLMGRLIEIGLLQDFLKENCGAAYTANLCAYKDSLKDANEFLWGFTTSPHYKLPLIYCNTEFWECRGKEYTEIELKIFSKPEYLLRFLIRGVVDIKEMVLGCSPHYRGISEWGAENLKKYLPNDCEDYKNSLFVRDMDPNLVDAQICHRGKVTSFACLGILLFCLFFFPDIKTLNTNTLSTSLLFVLCLFANAFINVCFSTMLAARYHERASWILVFGTAILLISNIQDKKARAV